VVQWGVIARRDETEDRAELGEAKLVAAGVVHFRIGGHVKLAEIEKVIFAANDPIRAGLRVVLFLDGYEARGYDGEGRKVFQTWALNNRDSIEAIWVLFSSPLIKMGANLVGVFTGGLVHSVAERAEFERELDAAIRRARG
jgi:hypothetical protein